jgi:hypothetical protein
MYYWIKYKFNENKSDFDLEYWFWGNEIGKPLPNIQKYKIAKHAKANAQGTKKERYNIRNIPRGEFKKFYFDGLFSVLFAIKSLT